MEQWYIEYEMVRSRQEKIRRDVERSRLAKFTGKGKLSGRGKRYLALLAIILEGLLGRSGGGNGTAV